MRGVANREVEPGLAVADRRGGRGHTEIELGGSGVDLEGPLHQGEDSERSGATADEPGGAGPTVGAGGGSKAPEEA